jgi:hypothetical protein
MKQKTLGFGLIGVLSLFALGLLMNSCKKETDLIASPSYSISKFVGTYIGISSCDTGVVLFKIFAAADRDSVKIAGTFGEGDCQVGGFIYGRIIHAYDSIKIDSTYFQDYCFGDYWVNGGGQLRNDSLFISLAASTPVLDTVCFFMGKKIADTASAQ